MIKRWPLAPVLAGGCLGPIIPPSTIMIIMSSYTGVSAGWLFAGGALPGVGLALLLHHLYRHHPLPSIPAGPRHP